MSPQSPKPDKGSSPLVFISHAHQDAKRVRRIKYWLETTGCRCWAFWERCIDTYREEIDEALIECNVFLLIGSKSSFQSKEVKRELVVADLKAKPIVYYKLDNTSHLEYKGFLTILGNKQFIQSDNESVPKKLVDLAKAIYGAWGKDQASESIGDRHQLISELYEKEIQKLIQWRERLWTLKIDSKGRAKKSLSNSDRAILRSYATDLQLYLSIEDEEKSCKPKKGEFNQELRSIVAKLKIDKRMLSQVERKRIECFIPRNTAVQTLERLLAKNDYLAKLTLSRQASLEATHWFIESVFNLKKPRTIDHGLDRSKNHDKRAAKTDLDKDNKLATSIDSSLVQASSSVGSVAETNDQQADPKSDHLNDSLREGSIDKFIDAPQSGNLSSISDVENKDQVTTTESRSSELPSQPKSYLYSLDSIPSRLYKPVSVLVREIAAGDSSFSNLMTASDEIKRQTAERFNIHNDQADKLVMHVSFDDERGIKRQILISSNYLSISGQRPAIYPYHFPLVISNPARRIVMTIQDRLGSMVFSYSPRFGTLEKCSQFSLVDTLFTKHTSNLFQWLLILLESANADFLDSTNLTNKSISHAIDSIQAGSLHDLDLRQGQLIGPESTAVALKSKDQVVNDLIIVNKIHSDQIPVHLDWRDPRSNRFNNSSSESELQKLHKRQSEIVSKLTSLQGCQDILRQIDPVPSKSAYVNTLAVNPTEGTGSPSMKAKVLHGIQKANTGRLLLHLNVGRIRGGSGLLIYMNGFSLCSGFRRSGFIRFGRCMDLSSHENLMVSAPSKTAIRFHLMTKKNDNRHFASEHEFRSSELADLNNLAVNIRDLIVSLDSHHRASEALARLFQAEWRLAYGYLDFRRIESLTLTSLAKNSLVQHLTMAPPSHEFLLQFTFAEGRQHSFLVMTLSGVFLCGVVVPGQGVRPTPVFIKWESLVDVLVEDQEKLCFAAKDLSYFFDFKRLFKNRLIRDSISLDSMSELARFAMSLRNRLSRIG
jgi:hypothetical protein